jgi:hypothetical protein
MAVVVFVVKQSLSIRHLTAKLQAIVPLHAADNPYSFVLLLDARIIYGAMAQQPAVF